MLLNELCSELFLLLIIKKKLTSKISIAITLSSLIWPTLTQAMWTHSVCAGSSCS